jgi:hypothetical protein
MLVTNVFVVFFFVHVKCAVGSRPPLTKESKFCPSRKAQSSAKAGRRQRGTLTAPVGVGKVHDNLAIELFVPWPDQEVSQCLEATDNEATHDEDIPNEDVQGDEVCFHPTPPASHGCRINVLL